MVRGVDVRGDHVDVTIALTVAGCPMKADLEGQVRHHVGSVDGVATVGPAAPLTVNVTERAAPEA